jgi:tetratricopeptide (TPR) repeat protein
LAGLGRFEEAVSECKIALKQSPRLPDARLNLGLAYYKMGRIADAARQLEKAHNERSDNHQTALLLGDCYLRMDECAIVVEISEPLHPHPRRRGHS